ncbi:hypothetical protein [Actinomyces qiguomingii]|uniref:hypothetical protein n=1 Tax=Actinomyces qiguomingii TaxID=2057800 RepID=UPI000CA0161D|nr:hypothetical protein [Actinomyces qiguomingii]
MKMINGQLMLDAEEMGLLLDLDADTIRAHAQQAGTGVMNLPALWVRRGQRALDRVQRQLGHRPDIAEALDVLRAERGHRP